MTTWASYQPKPWISLVAQRGALRGHRLALEVGAPVYQDVNGLQLETDWVATLGWQRAF